VEATFIVKKKFNLLGGAWVGDGEKKRRTISVRWGKKDGTGVTEQLVGGRRGARKSQGSRLQLTSATKLGEY